MVAARWAHDHLEAALERAVKNLRLPGVEDPPDRARFLRCLETPPVRWSLTGPSGRPNDLIEMARRLKENGDIEEAIG